jgi:hypothetical protein
VKCFLVFFFFPFFSFSLFFFFFEEGWDGDLWFDCVLELWGSFGNL